MADVDQKLGIVLDGVTGYCGVAPSRLLELWRAFLLLASLPRVPVDVVRHVIGKHSFAAMCLRLSMSPAVETYRWLALKRSQFRRVPRRVAREWIHLGVLSLWTHASLRRPVSSVAICSDACTTGGGFRFGFLPGDLPLWWVPAPSGISNRPSHVHLNPSERESRIMRIGSDSRWSLRPVPISTCPRTGLPHRG